MQIEKNVPVPPAGRSKIEIINDMEIGDSVLCETYEQAMSLRDALRYRGLKYTTRKIENEGWRVWRLA
jgi:hypothetical protein